MILPILLTEPVLTCNRCGECCKTGAPCAARQWFGAERTLSFTGTCELLEELPDGTTQCRAVVEANRRKMPWLTWTVIGTCDFPELRKEIGEVGKC